jgi:hypothetical protein
MKKCTRRRSISGTRAGPKAPANFGAHKLNRDAGRNEHAKKPYYKPHRGARRSALMVLRQAHRAKAS